ncbi:class I SAM-dependent DNA methyltransferase [Henriciella marina]|uniref:class I SAM-dependent DNA methyltransferase n=1 Tax=Henriciella marina TaxID=453851 RepID=UPI0003640A92|nr:DNA methyltransferase [Henriciella marina]
MTPSDFIRKWERSELKESASAQQHFLDLCELLDVAKPADMDHSGDSYCFEKGATKSTGGQGFADVWKKGHFGWEYKGPKAKLDAAYTQLQRYAVALESPPLLIVSDTKRIVVRTNWTNTVSEKHEIELTDLVDQKWRDLLRNCFTNPGALKPKRTRDDLTREAADDFSKLAQRLRDRGHHAQTVAHFVNRLVFCMFAEDVNLLPNKLFQKAMERSQREPDRAEGHLTNLFAAMQNGGEFGLEDIPWFNGGLFDSAEALAMDRDDVDLALKAAKLYWGDIDPSILGTLFERGLDPSKRSQLGAHYTDREKIMMIVNPVIVDPLEAEWEGMKAQIEAEMEKSRTAKSSGAKTQAYNRAVKAHSDFIEKLAEFRVLDPACGSGNFLYLSLKALKDIEHKANVEAEALGLPRGFPRVGPEAVKGIELNPYAAELARVSIWIGEIQWMRENGFSVSDNPILKPLNTIECRDAILNADGTRAEWPEAEVVVGNPPFLGDKKMLGDLGSSYVISLREAWTERVPGGADLVTYWFAKAWKMIGDKKLKRAGLVSTNSIRGGANRDVLRYITEGGDIFEAWSDEPWIVDGAAVRVSIVCFSAHSASATKRLNGEIVAEIQSDLDTGDIDFANSTELKSNLDVAFIGNQKGGSFDVSGTVARNFLELPSNPNGKKNQAVIRPWSNGLDVVRRPRDMWIIDFTGLSEMEAAFFESPFRYIQENVKPYRKSAAHSSSKSTWWLHQRPRHAFRKAIANKDRCLATARLAKHRVFVWLPREVVPDSQIVAIARDDDTSFGILHSKFHELWSLRMGTSLEDRPRYTPTTCFETFPFPKGLTPDIPAEAYADDPRAQAIAVAAARLNELRENWLNPPDLIKRVPEVVEGYPDRIVPVDEAAEKVLKKRTLTNLYNERPAWLDHAHRALDEAVADAYGWGDDFRAGTLTDEEILKRLFDLNQARAAKQ